MQIAKERNRNVSLKIASTSVASTLVLSFAALVAVNIGPAQASTAIEKTVSEWQANHDLLRLAASCDTEYGLVSTASVFVEAANKSELTVGHRIQIGSVAKTFTAPVILGLVGEVGSPFRIHFPTGIPTIL
jgi:hypothetical protein